jgi:hypothetical protein
MVGRPALQPVQGRFEAGAVSRKGAAAYIGCQPPIHRGQGQDTMHTHPIAALTPRQHARLVDQARLDAHRLRDEAIDAAAAALLRQLRRTWAAVRRRPARLIEA